MPSCTGFGGQGAKGCGRAAQVRPGVSGLPEHRCGGTGLNLQTADTVVNLELPWNPAVLEQRIARRSSHGPEPAGPGGELRHAAAPSRNEVLRRRSQAGALCRRSRGGRGRDPFEAVRTTGFLDSMRLSSTARRVASVSLRWKHRRADHDRRPRVWLRASVVVLHFSRNRAESHVAWNRAATGSDMRDARGSRHGRADPPEVGKLHSAARKSPNSSHLIHRRSEILTRLVRTVHSLDRPGSSETFRISRPRRAVMSIKSFVIAAAVAVGTIWVERPGRCAQHYYGGYSLPVV